MRLEYRRISLEVGRGARKWLDVYTPFRGVQVECCKGSCLTQGFRFINILIAAVIPCTRIALGVFVTHYWSKGIEDTFRREILGSDQHQRISLPNLLCLHYWPQFRVCFWKWLIQSFRPLQWNEQKSWDQKKLRILGHNDASFQSLSTKVTDYCTTGSFWHIAYCGYWNYLQWLAAWLSEDWSRQNGWFADAALSK